MPESKEKKAGTVFIEITPDLSSLKRTLKNLLTAIEASEKGTDVIPDFSGSKPPTFGVLIGGKLFDVGDVDLIKGAIKNGQI